MKRGAPLRRSKPPRRARITDDEAWEARQAARLVREEVLARCGGRCEAHASPDCTGRAEHLHHRRLRSQGGDNTAANLLGICHSDHAWIHANPVLAECAGLLVPSWVEYTDEVLSELANLTVVFRSGNPRTPTWRTDPGWRAEALSQFARLHQA